MHVQPRLCEVSVPHPDTGQLVLVTPGVSSSGQNVPLEVREMAWMWVRPGDVTMSGKPPTDGTTILAT